MSAVIVACRRTGGSSDGAVYSASLDDMEFTELSFRTKYPTGLGFDPIEEKIYWAERTAHRIVRSDLDGSNEEVVVSGLSSKYIQHHS